MPTMSDDTPTQRFPSTGGDLPTQRLDTAEVQEDLREEKQKSKSLLIGLIIAGALLLVAAVAIIFVLLGGAQSDPLAGESPTASASPEPSPGESVTPEPTPTETEDPQEDPPSTTPQIDSFAVSPSSWACNTSAPIPVDDPQLSFSWSTTNATHVYFGVGATNDAEQNGMGWENLPVDGSSGDFPGGMDFTFNCPVESQSYTITATDDAGHRTSRTVTVTNTGDTQ
jgi:cytoskeletal protein RodZ